MIRALEYVLGALVLTAVFAPVAALVAGVAVLVGGAAFLPVFMPLTTLAFVGVLVWQARRHARRRRAPD